MIQGVRGRVCVCGWEGVAGGGGAIFDVGSHMGIFTLAMHGALAEKRRERRARSEGATTAASGGAGDGGETEAWRRCVRGQCGDGDCGHGIPPRPASPPLVEIHSFEPQKVLHMILGANVVLTNAWQEIFPHHLAISDHVGVLQANAADTRPQAATLR